MNGRQLTATVWQHAPSRYGGTALLVLLKLAGLSAKDGYSYASVGYLAQACGATPRAISKVLKTLRKDCMVKVQHRKGHSSKIFVNWEGVNALPLAVATAEEGEPKEEQPTAAEQPKETEKRSPAQDLSDKLRHTLSKDPGHKIPSDWNETWPIEFQKLLDAGHSVETIRSVTRFALSIYAHREELLNRGPVMLAEKFPLLSEQAETFGKAAA